jgi:hypothetical protein
VIGLSKWLWRYEHFATYKGQPFIYVMIKLLEIVNNFNGYILRSKMANTLPSFLAYFYQLRFRAPFVKHCLVMLDYTHLVFLDHLGIHNEVFTFSFISFRSIYHTKPSYLRKMVQVSNGLEWYWSKEELKYINTLPPWETHQISTFDWYYNFEPQG